MDQTVASRPATHYPGLDGLRAVAAVVGTIYHANLTLTLPFAKAPLFSTGFYFADFFGVLSAYLITSLLLAEYDRTGRIDLRNFYRRRFRRLLPVCYAFVVLAVLATGAFYPDQLYSLRGAVAATLGYVHNWYAIVANSHYFTSFELLPINHLWQLSLEEQFYFVWPLTILLLLLVLRKFRRLIPWLLMLGAFSTVVFSWWMFRGDFSLGLDAGAPFQLFGNTINRELFTYLSTPSRAGALLAGAALAFWHGPSRLEKLRNEGSAHVKLLDRLSLGALAGIVLLCNVQLLTGTDRPHTSLVTVLVVLDWVCTGLLIVAVTTPGTVVTGKLLANRFMVSIGTCAYGLYLLIWPTFQFVRRYPYAPYPLLWLLPTLLVLWWLARLSLRYFENPIRRLGFLPWVRSLPTAARRTFVVVSTAATLTAVGMLAFADPPSASADPAATTPAPDAAQAVAVAAVGDSVMLMARQQLELRGVSVFAETGRTFSEGAGIASYLVEERKVTDSLVLHLGTDSRIDEKTLEDLLVAASDLRRVVLVGTSFSGSVSGAENNDVLREASLRHANVEFLDWAAVVADEPELLARDGIHLTFAGFARYADLVTASLGDYPKVEP